MTIENKTSFGIADDSSFSGSGVGGGFGSLPPPMVCIPGGPSPRDPSLKRGISPNEIVSTPTTSVAEKRAGDEKVGRWTEEEHEVFLEGLQLHGKQWKTIATMIGTRTVVQVRTHAQKYFQKMERKNKDEGNSATFPEKQKAGKRKSLPTSMPSRKKLRSPKKATQRATSFSLGNRVPPALSPNPLSASSASISSENLSTDSPVGVMDIDSTAFTIGLAGAFKDEDILNEFPAGLAEDPLEWLLDGDIQSHLPESSMEQAPMFPDFTDAVDHACDNNDALTLQAQAGSFDTSILDGIADPKVTVQSLFLDAGETA